MGGFFSSPKPDNSAYERALEEQRKATAAAEAKANKQKADQQAAYEKQMAGRANTLLTGGQGDDKFKTRKSLLGSAQ